MRQNLASDLADTLRDMVADGRLVGGERVNEGDLARALEVSRTPLREALCRLQGEGFVDAQPRLGFFVRTLDEGATRNLYQMRSVLEPTALELAGIPSAQGLRRLRRLDDDLSNARAEVETVIELDGAWHLELTSGCPNPLLVSLIERYVQQTRPLERAYLRHHDGLTGLVMEHRRITALLKGGDLAGAAAVLRASLSSGVEPTLDWLREAQPTPADMKR